MKTQNKLDTNRFDDFILISQRLNSCVDFISFYSDLEGLLLKYGNSSKFSVIIYFEQHKSFYIDYSNFIKPQVYTSNQVDIKNSLLYRAFMEKKAFYAGDSGFEENFFEINGKKIKFIGCEPLVYTNQIYGLLVFHDKDSYKELDIHWLKLVSAIASTSIINLQLYQETNQEATENSAKLWAINNAGELLSHMNLDVLLVKIMELSLNIVSAQVGSIMLDENGELNTKVEWGLKDELMKRIMHSSGVPLLNYIREQKTPFMVLDTKEDDRIIVDELDVKLDSFIIIPLYTNDRFLGVVNIINSSDRENFSNKDIELLVTVTNLLSISIENAILYKEALEKERIREQLNIARKIQQDLMPDKFPELEDYFIDGINITCDETGGDYYDYYPENPENKISVIIGDVSGHGIGAALFMATARAHIRASISSMDDLSQAISTINNLLISDMEKNDQFMTLMVLTLDMKEKELKYISAGHETAIIYRPCEDTFIELHSTGLPVGLVENYIFEEKSCKLREGDLILLYTDGIKEAMDYSEEIFGFARIKETLKKKSFLPVNEIKNSIINEVKEYCMDSDLQDDLTLVIIKVKEKNTDNISVANTDNDFDDIPELENLLNQSTPEKIIKIDYISGDYVINGTPIYNKVIPSNLALKEDILEEILQLVSEFDGITEQTQFDFRLCLDEAITNGILHGNDGDINKKLFIEIHKEDSTIIFKINDEGPGFDRKLIETVNTPASWYKENGRGLFLMAQLMDEVVFFKSGAGVYMKKILA